MSRKQVNGFFLKLLILVLLLVGLYWIIYQVAGMLAPEGSALDRATRYAQWSTPSPVPTAVPTPSPSPVPTPVPTPEPTATPEPTPTPIPTPTPLPEFNPVPQDPSELDDSITSQSIRVRGTNVSSYQADEEHFIDFSIGEEYTDVKGIVTFRGNNFRNTAQYGLAEINSCSFGDRWCRVTSGMTDSGGSYWSGSGWTGQPLIVEWPQETKKIMNMYSWAKEKEGLVEVIYATMGGRVYFYDLATGESTRDSLYLGYTFKGAGALDPRGYPILYVGGGVTNAYNQASRIMVVSLIDGEVLYTIGANDSYAPRGWSAFDSCPLVDAETDQLIYPGENGVLYILDLNSKYDPEKGTISVDPDVIKFKYTSPTCEKYYYGMESSAVVWRGHLMIPDNGGNFICIDLNTLEIKWRFNCLDDTNCTAVLELDETGHPYVYLSTSFHYGWRSWSTAKIPVWKIDAVTGEKVWSRSYECYSEDGVSGGVQGSLALGTGSLDGILYVAMARHPKSWNGKILALDTETGEEVWSYTTDSYSWSSPTCFYDKEGNGYVLYTSSIQGKMYWFDGLTGKLYDTFGFGCTVEASPVVYNNTVVIGTRNEQVYGIRLK